LVHDWNILSKNDYKTKPKGNLCMSCWNKVRPIVAKHLHVDENRRTINKLIKGIRNERKNSNYR
jgi:hypothetical protein